jgi:flagellar hook-basal body complex protein FliE
MSAAAVQGKADMIDVLQAVTEAETTLNTVLSIRDRLVQSYQEIMRTPI